MFEKEINFEYLKCVKILEYFKFFSKKKHFKN